MTDILFFMPFSLKEINKKTGKWNSRITEVLCHFALDLSLALRIVALTAISALKYHSA